MSQTEVQLIKSSSVVDGDIVGMSSSKLSGTLPAVSAANLTNIPAANLTGALPAISGANLTGISSSTAYSYIDQWALNTTLSVSSTTYWAGSQLSRSDSYAVTIGSAMTVDSFQLQEFIGFMLGNNTLQILLHQDISALLFNIQQTQVVVSQC